MTYWWFTIEHGTYNVHSLLDALPDIQPTVSSHWRPYQATWINII